MKVLLFAGGAAVVIVAACSGSATKTSSSSSSSSIVPSSAATSCDGPCNLDANGMCVCPPAQSTGPSTGTGTGGAAATGTTATTGGGGMTEHGDCMGDGDCPGGHCVPVTPGGFKSCQIPPTIQSSCGQPQQDECGCINKPVCNPPGKCLLSPVTPYCGGAVMQPHNVCATDQCKSDGDCVKNSVNQICLAAGLLGREVAACMPAACNVDSDCKAEAGGICAPVEEGCCHTVAGLYCVYPSNGCRKDSDCKGLTKYCNIALDGSRSQCTANPPQCPG